MAERPKPIVEFDPFSAEMLEDPYSIYRRLRDEEPLHWSPIWGAWLVSRYDDVRAILEDNRFSARHSVQQLGVTQDVDLGVFATVATLPSTDPPQHTRLRKLVNKGFTPRTVERLREWVEEVVEERLAAAAERGEMNVVEDLASPLPTLVIASMLGIPAEHAPMFKAWSDAIMIAFEGHRCTQEQLDEASQAVKDFDAYLRHEIRTRQAGTDDLIVRLREASDDGDFLSEDEVVSTCLLLLVAGNETTTSLITNGMHALLENPAELARLQADPSLVPSAVEEFLRLHGPVHMVMRKATEDVEVAGGTIPKGDAVAVLLSSANLDDRVFDDPDELRIDREPNAHFAFGKGRHFCLGASLARVEAQEAFAGMLRHFEAIELRDGTRPEWTGSLQHRRVDEVPIRVVPRTEA